MKEFPVPDSASSAAKPAIGSEQVLANVTELTPWLRDRAADIEQARRIPADVAQRLTETGLFALLRPKRFGGHAASPHLAWEATFEVAKGCSSCAWLAGLTSANILTLGQFSIEAQNEVFAPGVSPIVPMLTGGVGSDVVVESVDGGILLSGTWRYASGIDVADWVGLLVEIPRQGSAPQPHIVLVEQARFVIDHDSWRVIGMRGTGSKTVSLKGAIVPRHRFMNWEDLQAGKMHPTNTGFENSTAFPLNLAFAMSVLAPTLGVASAASEACIDIIRSRVRSSTQTAQIADKLSHVDVGSSAAMTALFRDALIAETLAIAGRLADRGALSPEERGRSRTKIAVVSRQALASAQRMFASIGGSILPEGSRIERLFRDIHAMSSHFLLQPEPIAEAYGRLLLGLEPPSEVRL